MKSHTKRRAGLAAAAVLVALALVLARVVILDWTYVTTVPHERDVETPARVLVAYYSRTGNTEGAARAAAGALDADLLRIVADRYPPGPAGWLRAMSDARAHARPPITHDEVVLEDYALIVLAAPIWLERPAPPIEAFVAGANLEGRAVLLLTTANATSGAAEINRFGAQVEARGARFLGHVFIERGRVLWQKTPADVNREVRAALATHPALAPFR